MRHKFYSAKAKEEMLKAAREHGLNDRRASELFGVPQPTFNRWRKLYKAGGFAALERVVKVVGERGGSLPPEIESAIGRLKKESKFLGLRGIQQWISRHLGFKTSRKQIHKVLKREGLYEKKGERVKEKTEKPIWKRFEASSPNELWQLDIMYVHLLEMGTFYLISVLDDHSRFVIDSQLFKEQRREDVISVLEGAIKARGLPKAVLTDCGSQFVSWKGWEDTLFQKFLLELGIEHITAEPHHPQTIGKIERWHQTVRREFLAIKHFSTVEKFLEELRVFLYRYNYERPHQGIGGALPADRYFRECSPHIKEVEKSLLSKGIEVESPKEMGLSIWGNRHLLKIFMEGGDEIRVYMDGKPMRVEVDKEKGEGINRFESCLSAEDCAEEGVEKA